MSDIKEINAHIKPASVRFAAVDEDRKESAKCDLARMTLTFIKWANSSDHEEFAWPFEKWQSNWYLRMVERACAELKRFAEAHGYYFKIEDNTVHIDYEPFVDDNDDDDD